MSKVCINSSKICITSTHDLFVAWAHLAASHPANRRVQLKAAIAFTMQLAIECGYDTKTMRDMESDLMARMETYD